MRSGSGQGEPHCSTTLFWGMALQLLRDFSHSTASPVLISWCCSAPRRFLELERPWLSKASRTLAFVYPYLFDSIPLFYRFYVCAARSCADPTVAAHYRHTAFAFLTCFIFATHLPERLAPGHFDYIGHSHQVFHVCGILGTHFQLEAILMDMSERQARLPATSLLQALAPMGTCMAVGLAVIAHCSAQLCRAPEPSHREKLHGQ